MVKIIRNNKPYSPVERSVAEWLKYCGYLVTINEYGVYEIRHCPEDCEPVAEIRYKGQAYAGEGLFRPGDPDHVIVRVLNSIEGLPFLLDMLTEWEKEGKYLFGLKNTRSVTIYEVIRL